MDLATTLHGGYMSSLGLSSRETTVLSTWDRGVAGCPKTSRRGASRFMASAYLPHKSFHATGDHHAVLGVSRFATKQEIKKSYRRLALELHPDVCTGDHCSTRFQQVQRAYEVALSSAPVCLFSESSLPFCYKLAMALRNHQSSTLSIFVFL